ncbi:MAG TPA: hypothetical protein VFA07_12465 [Chthonomonadaceae bacterium]|nr:hypothetical protein [Chthonomonadaceae bacterium]
MLDNMLHVMAKQMLDAFRAEIAGKYAWDAKPQDYASGRAILDAEPRLQIHVLLALNERYEWILDPLQNALYARSLPWTAEELEQLLACSGHRDYRWSGVLRPVQRFVEQGNSLTPAMKAALSTMLQCATTIRMTFPS